MATIIYNSENIADPYAPSLNAAFAQLYAESGVKPYTPSPYGAWSSPAIDKANGIKGRGANSDHYKGRAVDLNNYRAIEARIGRARVVAIMAAHGWFNVQSNGAPFPTEPWHYANRSSTPQGTGGVAIPGTSSPPPRRRSKPVTQLFGFVMPNPVPPKYLAENSGLTAGGMSYLAVNETEFVTQDQTFIRNYCVQQFGIEPAPVGILAIHPAFADQLWDKSVARRNPTVTVDFPDAWPGSPDHPAVAAALEGIEKLLEELPAEIDAYADGKKQSS